MKNVTDIKVEISASKYCVSCHYKGDRYHVWLTRPSREVKAPLYKRTGLGDLDTRQVKVSELNSMFAAGLISTMLEQAETLQLFEASELAEQEREAQKQRERDEERRLQRMHSASLELFEACELAYIGYLNSSARVEHEHQMITLRNAIASATVRDIQDVQDSYEEAALCIRKGMEYGKARNRARKVVAVQQSEGE